MPAPFAGGSVNRTSTLDIFTFANDATGGAFGAVMVGIPWLVMFAAFYNKLEGRDNAVLLAAETSSFIAFAWAISLEAVGFVSGTMVAFPFAVLLVSGVVEVINSR